MGIYKATARTPQKAFENIWLLLQNTDDFALREIAGGWEIRLEVKTDERLMEAIINLIVEQKEQDIIGWQEEFYKL